LDVFDFIFRVFEVDDLDGNGMLGTYVVTVGIRRGERVECEMGRKVDYPLKTSPKDPLPV
jgi:hypothetical protein